MSMSLGWWIALLALLRCVAAQATGTIHLFSSTACAGSHMSCGNIPAGGCCTTGGSVFGSAFLVSFHAPATVGIHSNPECTGVSRHGSVLSCLKPSFAFSAAKWTTSSNAARRGMLGKEYVETTPSKDCRRPDSIVLIDDDGQETKISIPDGKNTDYEHAFVHGNFTKLLKMGNINRTMRFSNHH